MSEIWLFIAGQTITLVVGAVAAHNRIVDKMNEKNNALSERLVKIETTLDLMGLTLAKSLHKDDDRYGIDKLLDKYIDRHYELTFSEWTELMKECERVANDPKVPMADRDRAGMLAAICHHKRQDPPHFSMKSRKNQEIHERQHNGKNLFSGLRNS